MLRHLPTASDPRLLVGIETSDDAGVYQLSESLALVQTVDFFTPIVDDPYWFGVIAVTNALSDLYAMGARPLTALNLLAYPSKVLDAEIVAEILRGGAETLGRAGAAILGGHTIDDAEPKYGAAVTGLVDPRQILTNAGAQPGDHLLLTKPLGTGIISTALKADAAPMESVEAAVASMTRLNEVGLLLHAHGVHAVTDVTGFGLLGHLGEMLRAAKVGAELSLSAVPLLPGVRDLLEAGYVPGGSRRNAQYVSDQFSIATELAENDFLLLCDAQTSGGLLIAVPAEKVVALSLTLQQQGVLSAEIGTIIPLPGLLRLNF